MLRDFISWLDDYLQSEGPPAIAKAVLGILSVAALPGAVFGSLLIKSAALLVALFAVTALGLVLLADRNALRRELEEHKELVTRYCSHIRREEQPFYDVTSWDEVCVTDDRGNTDDAVMMKIRVLRPDMLFFRVAFGSNWAQPARHRRRVQAHVRSIRVDGAPGISLRTTRSWVGDRMHMIAHFDAPPKVGSEISLAMRVTWPQRCAPLMLSRQPDSFVLKFGKPISKARYEVILPAGRDAFCEPVGFDEEDLNFSTKHWNDTEKRSHYIFEAIDLEPHRTAGMKLELKRRGDPGTPSPQKAHSSGTG